MLYNPLRPYNFQVDCPELGDVFRLSIENVKWNGSNTLDIDVRLFEDRVDFIKEILKKKRVQILKYSFMDTNGKELLSIIMRDASIKPFNLFTSYSDSGTWAKISFRLKGKVEVL